MILETEWLHLGCVTPASAWMKITMLGKDTGPLKWYQTKPNGIVVKYPTLDKTETKAKVLRIATKT